MQNINEEHQIQYDQDFLKSRLLSLLTCIRCIDCEGASNTIEYIESPVAKDQRRLVKQMIRKNMTDKQILEEVARIFGKHSLIDVQFKDNSSNQYYQDSGPYRFLAISPLLFAAGLLTKWTWKRYFRKL